MKKLLNKSISHAVKCMSGKQKICLRIPNSKQLKPILSECPSSLSALTNIWEKGNPPLVISKTTLRHSFVPKKREVAK